MFAYKTSNIDTVEKGILADSFLKCETGDTDTNASFITWARRQARSQGATTELIPNFFASASGTQLASLIFTNGLAIAEEEAPTQQVSDTSEISDVREAQDTITQTLAINLSLLSKVLGVERKTLYNHRKTLPRDMRGYHQLVQLSEEIRRIVPHGLEAGTRTVFRDGMTLKDLIAQKPGDLDSISEFALYVAQEWRKKHG